MTEENRLLNEASFEIKRLRKENEVMGARLDMFDSIMALLHTDIARKQVGMTEDLVWKIEKHLEKYKAN